MIFLATETTLGPFLEAHPTLTRAMQAWNIAKSDPTCHRASLQTDYGTHVLSFERGSNR